MITSPAEPHIIAKLRHLAGPNPEGSKLTNNERLHLIYLLGAMVDDETAPAVRHMASQIIIDHLTERGMTREELIKLFEPRTVYNPVQVADMIAVHPSLKHPYLD